MAFKCIFVKPINFVHSNFLLEGQSRNQRKKNENGILLPEGLFTNEDLEKVFSVGLQVRKLKKKIGIRQRHIAAKQETALDLAFEASLKVLRDYDKNKIDFILLCTQSLIISYQPALVSCREKLGLQKTIGAWILTLAVQVLFMDWL